MDWRAAVEQERAALMRLAALLHALASLAERAAGRSAWLRGVVLWLLRPAEAVACQFVADLVAPDQFLTAQFAPGQVAHNEFAPHHFHEHAATSQAGNRPEDALRLAASLRALAAYIEAQAALLLGGGRHEKIAPTRKRSAASLTAAALFASFGRAPDTS